MKGNTKTLARISLFFSLAIFADQDDIAFSGNLKATNHANAELSESFFPNDPLFSQQWSLNSSSGFDINALGAWSITRGDKNIAIVIIDTGIDYTHPDLKNNLWVNPHEIPDNGKDDDNNGYIDDIHGINAITDSGNPMDDNGHGTHVAGIIGAEGNNGIGIAGVMHKVSLIACKFLDKNGAGSTKAAIKCMDYVADLASRDIGVTIVATNNAWGGGPFNQSMLDAILEHRDLGILFVVDSGAGSSNLDNLKPYPASYDSPNIIVTAKADDQGLLTAFTNYGPSIVHVAAFGLNLLSTSLHSSFVVRSGSSATGFVSGIAGLIAAHNPSLTWAQIKHKIMAGVVNMADPKDESKIISGGFVNAFNSLSL